VHETRCALPKAWIKSCIVCADTSRAGAFDQTRQSATKARFAYFGSYYGDRPGVNCKAGRHKFKKERFEVIIVDTSGQHKQESRAFRRDGANRGSRPAEMTVLILDASICIINLLLWAWRFFH